MTSRIFKTPKSELFFRLLLLFVFTIPISQFVSIRLLVLVLVTSFFVPGSGTFFPRLVSRSLDLLLYLLVLSGGLLYSEELLTGYRVIETSLSLLVLPILFNKFEDFNKGRLHEIFYAFASGLFVACLICLSNAGYAYFQTGRLEAFFFDNLTEIIDSHPTYLAYYLIAVLTFGLYLLYYEKIRFSPAIISVFLLFFFLMLMLTGGLTAFVGILLIFSFFVLKYLLEEKSRRQTLTVVIVIVMMVSMFVFNTINLKEKNDYWERFVLWESALNATPDIIFGVGTGDYKKVLYEYYVSHKLYEFADSGFNSHNQFIEIFFTNGLVGVVALIIMLGRPLYLSVRNQNILGTLTFFSFFIYGMTEVFLGRYQGVVFFALLHQSFVTYYLSHKPAFPLRDV